MRLLTVRRPATKDEHRAQVMRMSRLTFPCPKCGAPVHSGPPAELTHSDFETRRILSVRRFFRDECPQHGYFEREIAGHHQTLWRWKFRRCFRKGVPREALSSAERRRFSEMLHGKLRPDWEWLRNLLHLK